jgi:hypothetical protein
MDASKECNENQRISATDRRGVTAPLTVEDSWIVSGKPQRREPYNSLKDLRL